MDVANDKVENETRKQREEKEKREEKKKKKRRREEEKKKEEREEEGGGDVNITAGLWEHFTCLLWQLSIDCIV